jgi:hypothetical protein
MSHSDQECRLLISMLASILVGSPIGETNLNANPLLWRNALLLQPGKSITFPVPALGGQTNKYVLTAA